MFVRVVLAALLGPTCVGATTVCEQLVLPGFGGHSWAPTVTTRLNIRDALALGKRLAKLDDDALIAHLERELPAGLMIAGASAAAIRRAVAAGEFAGVTPAAAQTEDVHKSVDSAQEFAHARWMHGVTSHDAQSSDDLRSLLVVPREAARLEADGRFVLDALRMNVDRYAPLIPVLGEMVQREGNLLAWPDAVRAAGRDAALRALTVEAMTTYGEPSVDLLDEAIERRGFLIVFTRAAFARRAHAADPAGPGSIVALPPGQGLKENEIYAIIPQSGVDLEDLKVALAKMPPAPRKAFSGRPPPAPPARVVVGQPRARRS